MPRAPANLLRSFVDRVYCDVATKSAIACRDGILEYLGEEIEEEPGRTYRVYRSPAATALAYQAMQGIALVDDHVDIKSPIAAGEQIGSIETTTLIDLFDAQTKTTTGVKATLQITDDALRIIESGKRELSLGYNAVLTASDSSDFDFFQHDIKPHHLAIVDRGRAGGACAFLDREMKLKMEGPPVTVVKKLSLHDEDGSVNLEMVAQLVQLLPDAIKKVPLDSLKELVPQLQAVIEAAKQAMPEEETPEEEKPEAKADEDNQEKPEDKKQESKDAAMHRAIQDALHEHTITIQRARYFVDEDYEFAGKTTLQIMRDALKSEHGAMSFSDSEVRIAFKMLKRSNNAKLAQFGDLSTSNPFYDLLREGA